MAESSAKAPSTVLRTLYSRFFTRSHDYSGGVRRTGYSFRYLFVSHKDPSVYDVVAMKEGVPVWAKTPATVVSLLRRLGLDPDFHHVFIMGTARPARGKFGTVVTSDEIDLWDYVAADEKSLYVRVEVLPLDDADIAAIRADGTFLTLQLAASTLLLRLLLSRC